MNQKYSSTASKIVFVYNAKSGPMHGIKDLFHKTVSPKSYPCKLCGVTFSGATMNKLWKQYIANLGIPTVFLHRDEFALNYPSQDVTFPVILIDSGDTMTTLLSSIEFKTISDLPELMNVLTAKLNK